MPNSTTPVILWFKDNLRLFDNQALTNAVETKKPIIPIFINDNSYNHNAQKWLKKSLNCLSQSLDENLLYFNQDNALNTILKLCLQTNCNEIWGYESTSFLQSQKDFILQQELSTKGISLHLAPPNLLVKRGIVTNKDNKPYQKFASFYSKIYELGVTNPITIPKNINYYRTDNLREYLFKPSNINQTFYTKAGEKEALNNLDDFISNKMVFYEKNREIPYLNGTSLLSANIVFGELSARTIWNKVLNHQSEFGKNAFLRQLVWRDFCHDLLLRYPNMRNKAIRDNLKHFPWQYDINILQKWQRGETGYPLVDAGMRELNQTGYMHNRVRMITSSFLTKHLLLPWQAGEEYFKNKLFDYDEANNAGNWQWVAGCGMDSAPFFRIFNPILQAQKFDPKQEYIKKYIPKLDDNYPKPIVDHKKARETALKAYHTTKHQI